MADFVTKTTESDRALERIHQLLAEIKAHQQSRLNYLKYPFQFFSRYSKFAIVSYSTFDDISPVNSV